MSYADGGRDQVAALYRIEGDRVRFLRVLGHRRFRFGKAGRRRCSALLDADRWDRFVGRRGLV